MRFSIAILAVTAAAVSAQSFDNSFLTAAGSCNPSNNALNQYESCVNNAVDNADFSDNSGLCKAYSGIWSCFSTYCPGAATFANYLTSSCHGGGAQPTSGSGSGSSNNNNGNSAATTTGSGSGATAGSGAGSSGPTATGGLAGAAGTGAAGKNAGVVGGVMGVAAVVVGSLAIML